MSPDNPTPRTLVLGLLLAADGRPIGSAEVIRAGELFAIRPATVRVAITRLARDRRIQSAGHGLWELAPAAMPLVTEVRSWRRSEQRIRRWRGDYIAVHTGPLGRADRPGLRRRERALQLVGLRELERGLHVRPNNVERDLDGVRARLLSLGLDAQALIFTAAHLPAEVVGLWDGEELNQHYRHDAERLQQWLARCHELGPEARARECYLLGAAAIRSLVYDPWLPAPFVDVAARHQFFETVCTFDDRGREIWSAYSTPVSHLPVGRQAPAEVRP